MSTQGKDGGDRVTWRDDNCAAELPPAGRVREGVAVSVAEAPDQRPEGAVIELAPLVRRVIAARVVDRAAVDDLVQETLVRVLAARPRLEDTALAPYAVVIARNLVNSKAKHEIRAKEYAHRLVEKDIEHGPEEELLEREDGRAVVQALSRLSPRERDALIEHELAGTDTGSLAAATGTTAGAVAAQLSRTRAKLRVEYLLALQGQEPPGDRCRPVLLALSAGDRRRQREVDVGGHLLECSYCAAVSQSLLDRRPGVLAPDESRLAIESDADVVRARQQARELAERQGFSGTDLTLIATAISEIARNIVRFASRGVMVFNPVERDGRAGISVVARDSGPGIPDVELALQDGYSTYHGMGLGLPGARRLMDEFEVTSQAGRGTSVSMIKWRDHR